MVTSCRRTVLCERLERERYVIVMFLSFHRLSPSFEWWRSSFRPLVRLHSSFWSPTIYFECHQGCMYGTEALNSAGTTWTRLRHCLRKCDSCRIIIRPIHLKTVTRTYTITIRHHHQHRTVETNWILSSSHP